ncbi:hypothetical protein TeGR_g4653, partial [Tetraparma gracilis]
YAVSDVIFRLAVGNAWHLHVLAGGAAGFFVFEASHVFIHKVEREGWDTPLLRPMIDFHLTHHVVSTTTYGFTSPFWDWAFGDLPPASRYQWPIVPIPLPILPFLASKALHSARGGAVTPRRKTVTAE